MEQREDPTDAGTAAPDGSPLEVFPIFHETCQFLHWLEKLDKFVPESTHRQEVPGKSYWRSWKSHGGGRPGHISTDLTEESGLCPKESEGSFFYLISFIYS